MNAATHASSEPAEPAEPAGAAARLAATAGKIHERYAHGADRPLGSYLGTLGTYSAVVAGLAGLARLTGQRLPDDPMSARDVVLTAAATHKLSRMLTKDPVTSPLRAPFTSYSGVSGPAELAEDVRGHGAQKAVGELVTCPFCVGVWVATGLTAGLVFAPKATRLVAGTFAALAGADALQFAHAWLEQVAE
jgi:Protein of unknown function (DUF1360)